MQITYDKGTTIKSKLPVLMDHTVQCTHTKGRLCTAKS